MSENNQSSSSGPTTGGSSRFTASRWYAVLPVVTLVVGLILGSVIAGLAVDQSSDDDPGATPTTPGDTATGPDGATPTGDVNVVVPKECLEAADTVEEATNVLREGMGSLRDFERQPLLDMLNRLEDLEAQARKQAEQCSEVDVTRSP